MAPSGATAFCPAMRPSYVAKAESWGPAMVSPAPNTAGFEVLRRYLSTDSTGPDISIPAAAKSRSPKSATRPAPLATMATLRVRSSPWAVNVTAYPPSSATMAPVTAPVMISMPMRLLSSSSLSTASGSFMGRARSMTSRIVTWAPARWKTWPNSKATTTTPPVATTIFLKPKASSPTANLLAAVNLAAP